LLWTIFTQIIQLLLADDPVDPNTGFALHSAV
jgi:hypothetical protein